MVREAGLVGVGGEKARVKRSGVLKVPTMRSMVVVGNQTERSSGFLGHFESRDLNMSQSCIVSDPSLGAVSDDGRPRNNACLRRGRDFTMSVLVA